MNTPERPDERVGLGAGVAYDPVKPLFNALRIRRRLTHLRTERFPVREDAVAVLEDMLGGNVTHSERDYDGEVDLLFEPGGGTLGYLNTDAHGGNGYLSVAASTRAYAGVTIDRLVAALRRDDTDDERVAMRLWTILITTNEEVGSVHPAIRRPGRCWAQVRFGRFSGPEARAWLDGRGLERGLIAGSRSLAELFAIERGDPIDDPADRAPLGFRA